MAVLHTGSLSAAARQLRVAQPTVRRRLEALEAGIGQALFTRSPSGLSPTEAARALAPHAEAMAAAAEAFGRATSAGTRSAAGTVRITASQMIGAEVLPEILAELRDRHPGLVFELNLDNRTEDLLRQEADIAIRMVKPKQAALVSKHVGPVTLGLYASPSYLQRHGTPRTLADLVRFSLIGPDRDADDVAAWAAAGLPRDRCSIRTDSHIAHYRAIHAGLGIGICQRGLAAREPTLVPLLADELSLDLETYVVMHEDMRRVPHVRVTFDHLVKTLAAYTRAR